MGDLQKLKCLANMFSIEIFQMKYLLYFIIFCLFCGKMILPGHLSNVYLEIWDWVVLFIRFNNNKKSTFAKKKKFNFQTPLSVLWLLKAGNSHTVIGKAKKPKSYFSSLWPECLWRTTTWWKSESKLITIPCTVQLCSMPGSLSSRL